MVIKVAGINYFTTNEFEKDFKRLLKKFRTLEDDLKTAKRNAIELLLLQQIDNQSCFQIPNFCSDEIKVYKLTKFACKSLKGRGSKSGIRVIFAFHVSENNVEFIEIYFK